MLVQGEINFTVFLTIRSVWVNFFEQGEATNNSRFIVFFNASSICLEC